MEEHRMSQHKDLSDRLVSALHLETPPVAVLWTTRHPDGVPPIEASKKGCQFLDVARFERRTFYTQADNHGDCKNGRYYLGFTPPFDGLACGDWPAGDYPDKGRSIFRTPAAFRRTFPHYRVVPTGTVKYLVFGPLDQFPFGPEMGGIVINVFCTAKAGLFLARAAIYEGGGVIEGPTGPSTCSMVMSGPLVSGQVTYTLGCFGFRQFVQIKPEEVVFGIPYEKLANVVDNLELLLKRRPDLVTLLAEPVGQAHVCTDEEVQVQKAPGGIVR
jgi:uncharacterized protein (DUF169 family)